MKPYYQDESVTLYHGDCREVLPTLQPDSVDLLVTDPPYGVRWQSGLRSLPFAEITGDDSTDAAVEGVALCLPLLKNARHAYVFGRYDFSALPFGGNTELVWDKGHIGPGDLTLPWGPQHEYIQFRTLVKSEQNRKRSDGALSARLRKGSVLRCRRLNSNAVEAHPTEKPVELLRQLIESSSVMYDVVLDPFSGYGSTLLAARLEGRHAIGVEIEERHCEATARRLSQGALVEMFR